MGCVAVVSGVSVAELARKGSISFSTRCSVCLGPEASCWVNRDDLSSQRMVVLWLWMYG